MLIACIISFIIGTFLMFCAIGLAYQRYKKPRNNVHFYVARDADKTLWLFLGKPIRKDGYFSYKINGETISSRYFRYLGLNKEDFKDLKWEDEPVEVFLNLED